jgi:hypothetical protein
MRLIKKWGLYVLAFGGGWYFGQTSTGKEWTLKIKNKLNKTTA